MYIGKSLITLTVAGWAGALVASGSKSMSMPPLSAPLEPEPEVICDVIWCSDGKPFNNNEAWS